MVPPSSRSKDRGCCRHEDERGKQYTLMPRMDVQEKRQAAAQNGKEGRKEGTERRWEEERKEEE